MNNNTSTNDLIKEIESYLPIPAYPTSKLCKSLEKEGCFIDRYTELQIKTVFDSGDTGGIVCSILYEKEKVYIVSLTHLKIKQAHPLSEKIMAYQENRIEKLRKER